MLYSSKRNSQSTNRLSDKTWPSEVIKEWLHFSFKVIQLSKEPRKILSCSCGKHLKAFEVPMYVFGQFLSAHFVKVSFEIFKFQYIRSITFACGARWQVVELDFQRSECFVWSLIQVHADCLQAWAPEHEPGFPCKRFCEVDTEYKGKQFHHDKLAFGLTRSLKLPPFTFALANFLLTCDETGQNSSEYFF